MPNASCITAIIPTVWKRLRRRTFAPRRPAVFPEQWGLVLVTTLAVALGILAIVLVLTQG
jgi:hypothetical protein